MIATKDERNYPSVHIFVDAREAGGADRQADFFQDFSLQAIEDRFVQFKGATGGFPFVVVTPPDRQDSLTVDYGGGDAYPMFPVRFQRSSFLGLLV